MIKFVDLWRAHEPLWPRMSSAIESVVKRSAFILGGEVKSFEEEFAAYCGTKHAVAVDNGTSALELSLRALGVGPGDEVIVPAMTFVATASSVVMVGAKPVMADVDPETYTIDPEKALGKVTPRTKAVIPVHLYGFAVDASSLVEASRGRFFVLEDACQAHGAAAGGKRTGAAGAAGAFSFYPSKNLGCLGDGGMVTTQSGEVAAKIRMLRNYGEARKYEHLYVAYNRRLDGIQAAVLRLKLKFLDSWNEERRKAADLYREALKGTELKLPPETEPGRHVYYVFAVLSHRRDRLAQFLGEKGIETGIHYPFPLHMLPLFKDLGLREGEFPVAERIGRETLSLPMYPGITAGEIGEVAAAIREFERSGS